MGVLFYTMAKGLARSIVTMLGPVTVLHRENSEGRFSPSGQPEPYLLACNHISHFDPVLISLESRREIEWMAMAELFRNRFAAAFFRLAKAFPADRSRVDREAVRTALKRLKAGGVVGIFPEGGIRTGAESILEGAPIRPGVAALAQMGRVPVVPCVVLGTDQLYSRRRWLPFRRARFWVGFGPPIRVRDDLPREEGRVALEEELSAAIRDLYRQLCEACPPRPGELPRGSGSAGRSGG